jgi:hypothetical protein
VLNGFLCSTAFFAERLSLLNVKVLASSAPAASTHDKVPTDAP